MSSNSQSCAFEGTTLPSPLSGLCTSNRRSVPISDVTDILLFVELIKYNCKKQSGSWSGAEQLNQGYNNLPVVNRQTCV